MAVAAQAATSEPLLTVGLSLCALPTIVRFSRPRQGYSPPKNLRPDLFFIHRSAALVQQLTAAPSIWSLSTGPRIRSRHRQFLARLHRADRDAGSARRAASKPGDQACVRSQGQDIDRGPKIPRIYLDACGSERAESGVYDTVVRWRRRRGGSRLCIGRGRAAILLPPFQFLCRVGRLHQSWAHIDYARIAVSRHGARPRVGVGAQAPRPRCSPSYRACLSFRSANRPKPSKSWSRQAGSSKEEDGPVYDFLHNNGFSNPRQDFQDELAPSQRAQSVGDIGRLVPIIDGVSYCRASLNDD